MLENIYFVKDAHSLGATFLKILELDKSVKVAKKEEYDETHCPLFQTTRGQDACLILSPSWESFAYGRTEIVRRKVGVGNAPYSSRNLPRLSVGTQNGDDVQAPTSCRKSILRSRATQIQVTSLARPGSGRKRSLKSISQFKRKW